MTFSWIILGREWTTLNSAFCNIREAYFNFSKYEDFVFGTRWSRNQYNFDAKSLLGCFCLHVAFISVDWPSLISTLQQSCFVQWIKCSWLVLKGILALSDIKWTRWHWCILVMPFDARFGTEWCCVRQPKCKRSLQKSMPNYVVLNVVRPKKIMAWFWLRGSKI